MFALGYDCKCVLAFVKKQVYQANGVPLKLADYNVASCRKYRYIKETRFLSPCWQHPYNLGLLPEKDGRVASEALFKNI